MAFARRVGDMVEGLKESKRGQPPIHQQLPPATETFSKMKWGSTGLFYFADLSSIYTYLRFGKDLEIPPEWDGMFPKRLF